MVKLKTNIKIILLIVVLLFLTLALISCQPRTQIKEAKTVEINNEEEFKSLFANNIGEDYSLYTYELKSDLDFTDENWTPIAAGVGEFLMGTINGNNHIIKYKIDCEAQKTDEGLIDVENLGDSAYYSLIAKAKNLKVKNLKIEASITYENCANISYSSSLIGYAVDSVVISNVLVEGNILSKMPDLAKYNYDIEEKPLEKLKNYEGHTTQYIGGVVGYGFDNISFINVKSSVNVDTQKSSNGFAKDMFVGGIVAYVRSNILTNGANKNAVSNCEYSGNISATGMNVFAGGVAGDSANLNISQFILKNSNLNVYFVKKLKLGGIVGQAIRSNISEVMVMQGVILESSKITGSNNAIIDDSAIEAASIGGAVGYLKNNSEINGCSIDLNVVVIEGKKYYIGGLVGEMVDSSIKDCITQGNLMVSKDVNLQDYVFDFSGAKAEKSNEILGRVLNSAGIVGKVGYKASFNNVATRFVAFRNSCAEKHDDMQNFSIEKEVLVEDPNLENYLEGKGYVPYADFIDKVLQQKQSESQKKDGIVSCSVFFKIVANDVSYSLDSSVYENIKGDQTGWSDVAKNQEPLEFGDALSKEEADVKFGALKGIIEDRIIH